MLCCEGMPSKTGFVLAVSPTSSPVGSDARDLLGQDGHRVVRDFVASAAPAADMEQARAELFLLTKENQLSKELVFER